MEADLRCLVCGRSLGQLVGPDAPAARGLPTSVRASGFTLFQAAGPAAAVRRVAATEHVRCSACGGPGVIDEVRTFST